jgi:glycosyltransferase involved in cell wall biosynthesis
MLSPEPVMRVGYVVKRYPCYSETFIVREILAHERAGLAITIFSLYPTNNGYFQDLLARVRAEVNYLYLPSSNSPQEGPSFAAVTANHFWRALRDAAVELPGLWLALDEVRDEEARTIYQALILAAAVRRKGIEHLHAPFANEPCSVVRLAARFAGIPFSFTARAKDIFHETVHSEILRRKLRDAAGVVTISDFHLNYLRTTYGPLAAHVQRVYNGLDLEEFQFQSPLDRPPVILAVGRLVEKKGFADLIESCSLLVGRGRAFRCRIIGVGTLQVELQAQIHRLGLRDQVTLVGALPQGEVMQEIQRAAVVAMPCVIGKDGDRDGLPNVIQEALALGTPVVTTDVTGIPEVVRDGQTGLQVPQHDPPTLAVALDRLLSDAALRVQLASGARRLIEAEFDIRRNTEKRRAMFRASLGSRESAQEAV